MGLFKSREEKEREAAEINERIANSKCTHIFTDCICSSLEAGGEYHDWLMANSKERLLYIDVYKEGVFIRFVEVNQQRLKQTGTYDVDKAGFGFGASGYDDLPNSAYVSTFRNYLFKAIETRCSNIIKVDHNCFKLSDKAKQSW